MTGSTVQILPSADSYFRGANGLRVDFDGTEISHIAQLADGSEHDSAEIEPQLITNLFDSSREKRRAVSINAFCSSDSEKSSMGFTP